MSEKPSQTKRPPRVSRRRKRGHKLETEAAEEAQRQAFADQAKRSRAVKTTRQLDSQAFAQVDRMVGSFAQRRFGGLMPTVGKGFFAGAQSEAEAKAPEVQQAFSLFFVYGYRDTAGRRLIDMFEQYGLELDREQKRVLAAVKRARYVAFAVQAKNENNKQIAGRDMLRGLPMTTLDNGAFSQINPGDVLVAYMFPVGDLWRSLGPAVLVRRAKTGLLVQGFDKLARDQGFHASELPERRAAQVFWMAYRAAEAVIRTKV